MIRKLPINLINQIAAGEVVERPAAVVKELIENSIDAQATEIRISIRNGGQSLMEVSDNGFGIPKDQLLLATERYATSKLPHDDLFNIHSFGFRGEALAAIGAVSRLELSSCYKSSSQGWRVFVDGGESSGPEPCKHSQGTTVCIKDLFYAVPVRLKFLKAVTTETQHIVDIIKKIALANPQISFELRDQEKTLFSCKDSSLSDPEESQFERIVDVLGVDFRNNCCRIQHAQDGIQISGYVSLPTFNRANANAQFLFVNKRPVRDKMLPSVLRVVYQDYLSRDRFPACVIFIDIESQDVDVNVHPAKSEVRFRDSNSVRSALYSSIREALYSKAHQTSTTIHQQAVNHFIQKSEPSAYQSRMTFPRSGSAFSMPERFSIYTPPIRTQAAPDLIKQESQEEPVGFDLGRPMAQLFDTYILSATGDHFFIVDQHAAHERIVYERMKRSLEEGQSMQRQMLLIPHIMGLSDHKVAKLTSFSEDLKKYGLIIRAYAENRIVIQEVPALLKDLDLERLINDLLDEIDVHESPLSLKESVEKTCSTFACHGSIRAGKKLSVAEMEALLRQMEQTPFSGQCNHGRPTYVRLHKHEIEKLFDRR